MNDSWRSVLLRKVFLLLLNLSWNVGSANWTLGNIFKSFSSRSDMISPLVTPG